MLFLLNNKRNKIKKITDHIYISSKKLSEVRSPFKNDFGTKGIRKSIFHVLT